MTPGPFTAEERPGEALTRADVFMKSMAYMGYSVMNIGVLDVALGVSHLQELSKKYKIPMISANLYTKATGERVFPATLAVQAGPLKVGFFGLLSPRSPAIEKHIEPNGLEIRPVVQEAQTAVKELRAQGCDFIVLLSQLNRPEAEQVVNQVSGIHLVLGSLTQDMTMKLAPIGPSYYADAFQKGKFLGEVMVHVRGNRDRYFMAGRRAAMEQERQDLASQLMTTRSQLQIGDRGGIALTADARKNLEQQLADLKARQQKITTELEGSLALPPDASTLELSMVALDQTLPDDPTVDGWVKKFQKKYPKPKGGH